MAVPGGRARNKYERLSEQHRDRVRARRPVILAIAGVFAVAVYVAATRFYPGWGIAAALVTFVGAYFSLTETPQHIAAWKIGAEGEEQTARALVGLERKGYSILHDRMAFGCPGNIDHVVIGPTGVFVIETKSWQGKVKIRGKDIWVDGRKRSEVVDQVLAEASAVQAALGDVLTVLETPIVPLICVHRADLPLFGSRCRGVPLLTSRGLVRAVERGGRRLDEATVADLAKLAEAKLRG